MTTVELARSLQVHVATIHAWVEEGAPVARPGVDPPPALARYKGSPFKGDPELTRRAVAEMLGIHPDSVSRQLANGLGAAVTKCGGRGEKMLFSDRMTNRWIRATRCRRDGPCEGCRLVLDDMRAVARHVQEEGHAYGRCTECFVTWELCEPCL